MTRDLTAHARDLVWLLVPGACNACQQILESWHVIARHWWKVCTCIKRLKIRCQENRHGPAARTGHGNGGLHVNGVDVRSFLAVHFDVDEMLVHKGGDFGIFKRLMSEDVTPMA